MERKRFDILWAHDMPVVFGMDAVDSLFQPGTLNEVARVIASAKPGYEGWVIFDNSWFSGKEVVGMMPFDNGEFKEDFWCELRDRGEKVPYKTIYDLARMIFVQKNQKRFLDESRLSLDVKEALVEHAQRGYPTFRDNLYAWLMDKLWRDARHSLFVMRASIADLVRKTPCASHIERYSVTAQQDVTGQYVEILEVQLAISNNARKCPMDHVDDGMTEEHVSIIIQDINGKLDIHVSFDYGGIFLDDRFYGALAGIVSQHVARAYAIESNGHLEMNVSHAPGE